MQTITYFELQDTLNGTKFYPVKDSGFFSSLEMVTKFLETKVEPNFLMTFKSPAFKKKVFASENKDLVPVINTLTRGFYFINGDNCLEISYSQKNHYSIVLIPEGKPYVEYEKDAIWKQPLKLSFRERDFNSLSKSVDVYMGDDKDKTILSLSEQPALKPVCFESIYRIVKRELELKNQISDF